MKTSRTESAMNRNDANEAQLDKFKKAARELGADDDESRWDERLKKVVKPKSKPEKPE